MANLSKQKEAMVGYFRAGCKPEGQLTVGLEVEHFLTHTDGAPAAFEEVQAAMLALQQSGDVPLVQDGETVGLRSSGYVLTLEPAAQLEISITPKKSVGALMAVYEAFAARLRRALAPLGLRAWNLGYHPTRRAAALPLIPKKRYEVMDRYLQKRGRHGTQMMRGTASTQISVDYFSEQDFVRKFRVACLIAPLLALLTDNAPVYEGERNRTASVRTMVWNDVDPDRCGIPPMLMDEDFGFAAYADHVLQKPLIVARHGPRTEGVGRKSAFEVYPSALQKDEIEQILSMFFFDVRLKNYIEIRVADSMPAPFIAGYAELIKAIFSSPAAQESILRHYAGATVSAIEAAKLGICCHGYQAQVYGRPVADEIAWLMAQAKSRFSTPGARCRLEPLAALAARKTTLREELPL